MSDHPSTFSLTGGAGLRPGGCNVPHVPRPEPCVCELTYAHAVDLMLEAEEGSAARAERARVKLVDQLAHGGLSGLVEYQDARARLEAVRDCLSLLLRHERDRHGDPRGLEAEGRP